MPLTINSLVQNQNAQRTLESSQKTVQKQTEALASGKRVNSASDDAAGLAIISRMNTEVAGLTKASQNINDGISMLQVADGGLSNITDQLQRMRELSVQASNSTLNDSDRQALDAEFAQLNDQIQSTLSDTSFNGIDVLNSDEDITIQSGSERDQSITASVSNIESAFNDISLNTQSLGTQASASSSLEAIDNALDIVNNSRANIGATQNRLSSALSTNETNQINTEQSRSRIEDTDFAKSIAERIRAETQKEANITLQGQANSDRSSVLRLLG